VAVPWISCDEIDNLKVDVYLFIYFVALLQYKLVQVLGNGNTNLNLVNVYSDGNGNGSYCKGDLIDQLKNLAFPPGKFSKLKYNVI